MARWFVMDRRVASELKKNYFFICCRPPVRVRDSFHLLGSAGRRETEQAFSLTTSRLLPMFLVAYRRDSPVINS